MNTKFTNDDDATLLERIKSRVRWDIRVSNSDISIQVKNRNVVLLGYFDKGFRHAAAINIISNTEGVLKLDDQTQVLSDYYRSDKELEVLISKQTLSLPFLPGEWVDVDVCDGVARLEGLVFRPHYKAFVARACWELSGIKDCKNLIEIQEKAPVVRIVNDVENFNSWSFHLNLEKEAIYGM